MRLVFTCLLIGVLTVSVALAEEPAVTIPLVLKDHKFAPDAVTAPAGRRIRIELRNQDGTAEEFDSDDLSAEKQVGPHAKAVIEVGPLKPGTYRFIGELHAATAQGTLTVPTEP